MKSTRYLAHLSMFVVLQIVFTLFIGVATPITRITLTFVPMAVAGMMYGPVFGLVAALTADLIRATLWPIGPFFFGFSVSAAMVGALYGLLYKKEDMKKSIIFIAIFKGIVIHLFLNTFWVSIVAKAPYSAILVPRIVKELFLIPIEIAINLYLLPKLKPQLEGIKK